MVPAMACGAFSRGASTHFDDPAFISRFGFGLPNASINQTRLIEVYAKTADAPAITRATLDARKGKVQEHGVQTVQPRVEADLHELAQAYLDKNGLPFEHGTIVVWVEPGCRKAATRREPLLDDAG